VGRSVGRWRQSVQLLTVIHNGLHQSKIKSITEEILEEEPGNSVKISKLYNNEELQDCYVEFEA